MTMGRASCALQLLNMWHKPSGKACLLLVPLQDIANESGARCGTQRWSGRPAGPLTVDLQGCSRERGLVVVVAWLSRAALLPPDCVPDAQIIFGRLGP
jgi:hypothetical protein